MKSKLKIISGIIFWIAFIIAFIYLVFALLQYFYFLSGSLFLNITAPENSLWDLFIKILNSMLIALSGILLSGGFYGIANILERRK